MNLYVSFLTKTKYSHAFAVLYYVPCHNKYTHTQRTYSLFRNLGLRFLPVVNKYNQVVGTITRSDLTADALAETMLQKGKKHEVRYYFTVF